MPCGLLSMIDVKEILLKQAGVLVNNPHIIIIPFDCSILSGIEFSIFRSVVSLAFIYRSAVAIKNDQSILTYIDSMDYPSAEKFKEKYPAALVVLQSDIDTFFTKYSDNLIELIITATDGFRYSPRLSIISHSGDTYIAYQDVYETRELID